MKKWLLPACLLMVIAINACNLSADEPTSGTASAILDQPPFDQLTDSIEKYPENISLNIRRGELLTQQNNAELAYPDFKKAWSKQPDERTASLFTANLFMTGREQEGITLLKEVIRQFPSNPEFPRRLSEAYLQTGDQKGALRQFDNVLESNPNNFEAWYEKGILLSQMTDTTQAIAALEKAYALQPMQQFGLALANLYAETGNSKALAICDELIRKDSLQEIPDALYVKGIFFANSNLTTQALEQFELCISRDWKFTEAYIEKGIILFKEKNIDEALKTFALAARVSNTYPDAYYWMGRCYEQIGNKDDAKDNYLRAVALDKNFTEAKKALRKIE